MIPAPIDDIRWSHIADLIDGGASESGYLEFKRELPGGTDGAKREFLKDVSAFANASGGDIIYGIEEKDGVASKIVSSNVSDRDAEELRLGAIVRDNLAPRLAGFTLKWVEPNPPDGAVVLLARVHRSGVAPHMVTFKEWSKFFRRVRTANHQLDVHELREAFLKAAVRRESAEAFREERVALIAAGAGAVPLRSSQLLVVHFVPLRTSEEASDDSAQRIAVLAERDPGVWQPMGRTGPASHLWSIDGFCAYDARRASEDKTTHRYALMMRTGAAEFAAHLGWGGSGYAIEKQIDDCVSRYLRAMRVLEEDQPFAVFVSLLDVRGRRLADGPVWDEEDTVRPYEIDRDRVLLPEVVVAGISETSDALSAKLKQLYRVMWQASGLERPAPGE